VRFIRGVIVAPIWDMKPDGSARLVGRRNVHTGEVEKVEGWRVISARGELRLMSCAARSTSASVIHIWRRLKENGPGIPWEGLFTEPLPKEEQAVDFLTLPSTHDHAEPMNRSPNPAVAGDIRGHLAAASHMR
jgi:hypothetical protein